MQYLSPHFTQQELACRCCGELHIEQRLVNALETLRELATTAVVVHDAYRCPKHNAEVGGVPDSQHTQGLAADIRIPGLSLQEMFDLALRVPEFAEGGIGVYDGGFLHVDVRGTRARWARVNGEYVGIDQLVQDPVLLAQQRKLTTAG